MIMLPLMMMVIAIVIVAEMMLMIFYLLSQVDERARDTKFSLVYSSPLSSFFFIHLRVLRPPLHPRHPIKSRLLACLSRLFKFGNSRESERQRNEDPEFIWSGRLAR